LQSLGSIGPESILHGSLDQNDQPSEKQNQHKHQDPNDNEKANYIEDDPASQSDLIKFYRVLKFSTRHAEKNFTNEPSLIVSSR
jgi:hypothetical protein